MPAVRIDITGPKSREYTDALLSNVRAAVTYVLGAPDDRVVLRVVQTPADCVDVPPCRTDSFTFIDILMLEGREAGMKKSLVSAIRDRLAREPGIDPREVAVVIRDASTIDLDMLPGQVGA